MTQPSITSNSIGLAARQSLRTLGSFIATVTGRDHERIKVAMRDSERRATLSERTSLRTAAVRANRRAVARF